mmetsp:Transcript_49320/g.86177  ORF Transcript_49320/g.86177 Transcript_49320/m.86177 type:complete len:358 (-) Transcript_49320:1981-3054(-)
MRGTPARVGPRNAAHAIVVFIRVARGHGVHARISLLGITSNRDVSLRGARVAQGSFQALRVILQHEGALGEKRLFILRLDRILTHLLAVPELAHTAELHHEHRSLSDLLHADDFTARLGIGGMKHVGGLVRMRRGHTFLFHAGQAVPFAARGRVHRWVQTVQVVGALATIAHRCFAHIDRVRRAARVAAIVERQRIVPAEHRLEEKTLKDRKHFLCRKLHSRVFLVVSHGVLDHQQHIGVKLEDAVLIASLDQVLAHFRERQRLRDGLVITRQGAKIHRPIEWVGLRMSHEVTQHEIAALQGAAQLLCLLGVVVDHLSLGHFHRGLCLHDLHLAAITLDVFLHGVGEISSFLAVRLL